MADVFSTIVHWETGSPKRLSFEGLRSPSQNYDADLQSIGPIRRAIGPVNEPYSVGNVSVGIIDRARAYAIEKAGSAFKGTTLSAKFGSVASGLAAMTSIFTGSVDNHRFSNGVLNLQLKDSGFDHFKHPLRMTLKTLNTTVFPNLPSGQPEVLIPVVYGDLSAGGVLREGAPIPCYRIDPNASGKFRYVVAQHVMKSVDTIYVYGSSSHGITSALAYPTYGGRQMTVIDFDSDPLSSTRPNEHEVTVLGKGITDDGTTGGTLVTNVADIHEHMMLNYVGLSAGELNSTLYTTATDAATNNLYAGSAAPYKGAIVLNGDIHQDWLGVLDKMTKSWLMYTYIDRSGLVGIYLLTYTDASTALTADLSVTDSEDVIARSLEDSGNPNVYSEVHYQWVYNFTFGKFTSSLTTSASTAIARKAPITSAYRKAPVKSAFRKAPVEFEAGSTVGAPLADPSIADVRPLLTPLYYVHDTNTARSVAATYALLSKEAVRFVSFDLPARYIGSVDLNSKIGLTHFLGVDSSGDGYTGAVFRIVALETYLQPNQKRLRCTGIKLAA